MGVAGSTPLPAHITMGHDSHHATSAGHNSHSVATTHASGHEMATAHAVHAGHAGHGITTVTASPASLAPHGHVVTANSGGGALVAQSNCWPPDGTQFPFPTMPLPGAPLPYPHGY